MRGLYIFQIEGAMGSWQREVVTLSWEAAGVGKGGRRIGGSLTQ